MNHTTTDRSIRCLGHSLLVYLGDESAAARHLATVEALDALGFKPAPSRPETAASATTVT